MSYELWSCCYVMLCTWLVWPKRLRYAVAAQEITFPPPLPLPRNPSSSKHPPISPALHQLFRFLSFLSLHHSSTHHTLCHPSHQAGLIGQQCRYRLPTGQSSINLTAPSPHWPLSALALPPTHNLPIVELNELNIRMIRMIRPAGVIGKVSHLPILPSLMCL